MFIQGELDNMKKTVVARFQGTAREFAWNERENSKSYVPGQSTPQR
jgi:hypothetical protein